MQITITRLKAIIGGSAGNLVEWYDWYIYATLAVYFAPSFFPHENSTVQLLDAAAIFAVGFIMRPVGAWVMGIYGDRHGRKSGLALSVGLMCAGSLMIAVTPTYATAGTLAPVMLIIARMLQGLSVGGEYGASSTYLSEMATKERRGFWSSFQYVTLIAGQLLALAIVLVLQACLSEQHIETWGWRIPFALGALLALVIYNLRRRLPETASFKAMKTERPVSSAKNLWKNHPREFMLVIMMTAGGSLAFYAFTTYMQKFLINTTGFDRQTATLIMTVALIIFMLMQPLFGYFSDKVGRKPLLYIFGFGSILLSVPIFSMIAIVKSPLAALGLIMVLLSLLAAYTSIGALIKAELFPAHIRNLGVALPYALGNVLFGGTAEYVALWFKSMHIESGFYWYVTAIIGLTTIAFLILPETKRESLILED